MRARAAGAGAARRAPGLDVLREGLLVSGPTGEVVVGRGGQAAAGLIVLAAQELHGQRAYGSDRRACSVRRVLQMPSALPCPDDRRSRHRRDRLPRRRAPAPPPAGGPHGTGLRPASRGRGRRACPSSQGDAVRAPGSTRRWTASTSPTTSSTPWRARGRRRASTRSSCARSRTSPPPRSGPACGARSTSAGSCPTDKVASRHLGSRLAVEETLLGGATPEAVAFRASLVVGARSRSFRFLVRLVERAPLLPLPALGGQPHAADRRARRRRAPAGGGELGEGHRPALARRRRARTSSPTARWSRRSATTCCSGALRSACR